MAKGLGNLMKQAQMMQKKMAEVAGVDARLVNVKVKSGEGLDAVGREDGMVAHAVCLIESA